MYNLKSDTRNIL